MSEGSELENRMVGIRSGVELGMLSVLGVDLGMVSVLGLVVEVRGSGSDGWNPGSEFGSESGIGIGVGD